MAPTERDEDDEEDEEEYEEMLAEAIAKRDRLSERLIVSAAAAVAAGAVTPFNDRPNLSCIASPLQDTEHSLSEEDSDSY